MSEYSNSVNNYMMRIESALEQSLDLLFAIRDDPGNAGLMDGRLENMLRTLPDVFCEELSLNSKKNIRNFIYKKGLEGC